MFKFLAGVTRSEYLAQGASGQYFAYSELTSNTDIPQAAADMAGFGSITISANPARPVYVVLSVVTQKRTVANVGGTAGLITFGLYAADNTTTVVTASSPTLASNDFWTAHRIAKVPASKLASDLVLHVRGAMGAAGGRVNASANDPAWIGAFYG